MTKNEKQVIQLKEEIELMKQQRDMWEERLEEAYFQLDLLLEGGDK